MQEDGMYGGSQEMSSSVENIGLETEGGYEEQLTGYLPPMQDRGNLKQHFGV